MRKICSSSSLCALTSPSWHLGPGGDHHQLGGLIGSSSCGQLQLQASHKVSAADESVFWMLQRHLQLMPLSYAEAGFSVEEMLHHIRILNEMQKGRKLGLLVTASSRSKRTLHDVVMKDAGNKKLIERCRNLNADNAQCESCAIQPISSSMGTAQVQSIEIHFADHGVHSHSTALEALGLQQLLDVAGDHIAKVKKVQIFQRSTEGLGVLAIASIKLSTHTASLMHDSVTAAKGSSINALQSCCSFHGLNSSTPGARTPSELAYCSFSSTRKFIQSHSQSCLDVGSDAVKVAAAGVACINHDHDWSAGYAGGGFVNELLKKWWVNGDELSLSRQVGVGSSGAVYQGTYRGSTKVAVKLVNNSHDSHFRRELLALGSLSALHNSHDSHFRRELLALGSLSAQRHVQAGRSAANYRHILPLVGACRDSLLGRCVVVTRFMEGGSLHAYLQREPRLDNRRVLDLATDIAKGMLFLHSRDIVHMDLKSPNIFLDTDGTAVIGDLGCARAVNEKALASQMDTGTYRWMAPEAFGEEGGVVAATRMMDVYSFGMVVWELVSGEVPWAGKSPVQAAAAVVLQPGLRPAIPPLRLSYPEVLGPKSCPPPLLRPNPPHAPAHLPACFLITIPSTPLQYTTSLPNLLAPSSFHSFDNS